MADVAVPAELWEGDDEAAITAWLARDGERVERGALIAELMVQKAQLELRAPAAGVLHVLKPEDSVVRKGDVVARIDG